MFVEMWFLTGFLVYMIGDIYGLYNKESSLLERLPKYVVCTILGFITIVFVIRRALNRVESNEADRRINGL